MFISLSNDLLLGILIGLVLTLFFQIAQRWARSAQERLPCLLALILLLIGAVLLIIWFRGA
jgi:predicted PurR-regulated permease PerM